MNKGIHFDEPQIQVKNMKNNTLTVIIVALVVAVVLVGGGVFLFKPELLPFTKVSETASPLASVTGKPSGYVAVFLANNQVYFGKLSGRDSAYPVLSDVYYLRVQRSLVPPQEGDTNKETKVLVEDKKAKTPTPPEAKNELTLIKLGSELHGPVDEIQINRDQILYIENLKDDGKVVKAINDYKAKNK